MSTRNRTKGRLGAAGMAAVVSVATLGLATAQEAEDLTVDVGDCVELTSPAERLACFEAQVEAARQERPASPDRRPAAESAPRAPVAESSAPAPAPAAEPSAPAPAAAAKVRREPAGTAERATRRSDRRDERDNDAAPVDIVASVTELRPTVPNSYVITLDNGQVWRQTLPMFYPLQVGSEVRIYSSGRWGDRLTNSKLRGFIQVERVR